MFKGGFHKIQIGEFNMPRGQIMKEQEVAALIFKLYELGGKPAARGAGIRKYPEEAALILKLYELRREPVMREARKWCTWSLNFASAQDYFDIMLSENSDRMRMVFSYWDMAACLVETGHISDKLFNSVADEHMWMLAIIEPILDDVRKGMQRPDYLINLEAVIHRIPGYKEMLENKRQALKGMKAMAAERMKKK